MNKLKLWLATIMLASAIVGGFAYSAAQTAPNSPTTAGMHLASGSSK